MTTVEATRREPANSFDEDSLHELKQFLANGSAVQPESEQSVSVHDNPFAWASTQRQLAATQYEKPMVGRTNMFDAVLLAVVCEGHIIVKGNPGAGKTETAKTLGTITGLSWNRIQFTATLMPEDITGAHYPDPTTGKWEFEPGPVFANLILADEINRGNPKTLAGLLEASGEGTVTSKGETRPLPNPFTIIMTMNPLERGSRSVYDVPEAQLDRALAMYDADKLRGRGQMASVAARALGQPVVAEPVFNGPEDVRKLIQLRRQVRLAPELLLFIEDIVYAFDLLESELVYEPAERAARSLARMAQAVALFDGRAGATAADVRKHAVPVLQHRLMLKPAAAMDGRNRTSADVVREVLNQVPDPRLES